jgi:glycosyltransferase involved in cell wall biosynthesis
MGETWQQEADAKGLAHQVQFLGGQSLEQINRHLQWSHVLCLPSVRESGGGVLLEAMAAARPVIAVDYGGPAEIVDDEVGRLLDPSDSRSVVRDLTCCLEDICTNPSLWEARGQAGYKRARSLYSWDAKVEAGVKLYERLLQTTTVTHACRQA